MKSETRSPKPDTPRLAVIALGSNLGDSAAILRAAMAALEPLAAGPLLRSSLLRTAPVDCPPGSPDFVNAVVAFEPIAGETPESLLEKLHAVEQRFGRQRSGIVNEARSLDLDLIAFGNERRSTPHLTLPHPRATQRQFVLTPLAEILPGFQGSSWPATAGELARLIDQGVRK